MYGILQRAVAQANAHRPDGERIAASPHDSRHTFLRKLANEKGPYYALEASGHKSALYPALHQAEPSEPGRGSG
jgi:hypothetical protein